MNLYNEIEEKYVKSDILWEWTRLFIRSRQNNLPYEFRFNLYKKFLDFQKAQTRSRAFDLIREFLNNGEFYYDVHRCVPTVLLDLCLEALLISVDKYEEAYELCVELFSKATDLNKNNPKMIQMYFSMAFDIYIKTQNQQANIPTGFSAAQRFETKYPKLNYSQKRNTSESAKP